MQIDIKKLKKSKLYSEELGIYLKEIMIKKFLNGFWPVFSLEPEFQKQLLKILIKPSKDIIF